MQPFNINSKRTIILLVAIVVLAVVAWLQPDHRSVQSIAQNVESDLAQAQQKFDAFANAANIQCFEEKGVYCKSVSTLTGSDISLYLYASDSLVQWTSNTVMPPAGLPQSEVFPALLKLRNGWYYATSWTTPDQSYQLLGLLPIKYVYPFENKFLRNGFARHPDIPTTVELSNAEIAGATSIRTSNGLVIGSLYLSGKEEDAQLQPITLVIQFVLAMLLFYMFAQGVFALRQRFGYAFSIIFLLLGLVAIRAIMLHYKLPSQLYLLDVFNPKYYASTFIVPSLGDLVLDTLFISVVALYVFVYHPKQQKGYSVFWALLFVLPVYISTALITWLFKTIVIDSVVSFEVYNILSIGIYSIVGLTCAAVLLLIHFLLARKVAKTIVAANVKWWLLVAVLSVASVVFFAPFFDSPYIESVLFAAVWTACFMLLLVWMQRTKQGIGVSAIVVYISAYAILSTFFIENLYERKERNQREFFAGKLVNERDFIAEYLFLDLREKIMQDAFIRSFFSNPFISSRDIVNRINTLYLNSYFNRYDLRISTYDASGKPLRGEDSIQLATDITNDFRSDELLYVSDTAQNYFYLSWLRVPLSDSVYGLLRIQLTPKVYYGQNVYPELLLGSNLSVNSIRYNYFYAIYKSNKLIAQNGEYPYTYYWNKAYEFDEGDYKCVEEPEWEHSIQQFPNGKKVIVSIAREPVFEPVATFSYLFTFYLALLLLILFVLSKLIQEGEQFDFVKHYVASLRTRINYSMLFVIVLSFIIIGVVTISFFRRQYDSFYTDKLLRKEKAVHASLEYYLQSKGNSAVNSDVASLAYGINLEVLRQASINDMDINLFDPQGNLVVSSQPAIYEKGLLSRKMNPNAYAGLRTNVLAEATEQETVGGLKYLATYATLRNTNGDVMAYLGVPYLERSKNINDEVSSFLVALMNVYVFLLICAAVIAYFISNSITRPLTIISEKLRVLNLNKRNEAIEWKSNDEIGVLVGEYNKMIHELEQSAQKLAKSERESAWREMAKQIAHEIKNPLTPMKLSIQYLQRAINEGNPNIDQLAKKVTKTLEEQIENLSSIATAFSSFAKMPKPENEIIHLNELLRSIVDLFNREGDVMISLRTENVNAIVFADKNQMVSVFNNLVKNAKQSIPEFREGLVEILVSEADEWITVAVKDNGSGIPAENQDKVFVPNFTTKSSGTGLGLAIVKQMVEGAGGSIWFETSENGSVFFVRIEQYRVTA